MKENYEDNHFWTQALLYQYGVIREQEEAEREQKNHEVMMNTMASMMGAKKLRG